jgi:hypothetical protein
VDFEPKNDAHRATSITGWPRHVCRKELLDWGLMRDSDNRSKSNACLMHTAVLPQLHLIMLIPAISYVDLLCQETPALSIQYLTTQHLQILLHQVNFNISILSHD